MQREKSVGHHLRFIYRFRLIFFLSSLFVCGARNQTQGLTRTEQVPYHLGVPPPLIEIWMEQGRGEAQRLKEVILVTKSIEKLVLWADGTEKKNIKDKQTVIGGQIAVAPFSFLNHPSATLRTVYFLDSACERKHAINACMKKKSQRNPPFCLINMP